MEQRDEDVRQMLAVREGDLTAFDSLFRRWAAPLQRYLERMTRETAAAEELVQETFLRVYRARDRYQADARFSTWLYTIATRLALNELRRPRRRLAHCSAETGEEGEPLPLASESPPVEEVVEARRTGGRITAWLDELPERQRCALWLSAVEGLSYAEVARSLETTEKSVKALVHRARSSLAERLQKERSEA